MITIYGETIYDMYQAKERIQAWFEDHPWDIWLEETSYGPIIFIEDIYDGLELSKALMTLEEVKAFCDEY